MENLSYIIAALPIILILNIYPLYLKKPIYTDKSFFYYKINIKLVSSLI